MEMCRVRVLCGRAAADLALPAEVPLVDLIPDLVDLVVAGDDRWERPWQLVHPVRGTLPADESLARVGVVDGATLMLDDTPQPPPVIVEDVAETVGEVLAAGGRGPGRVLARWVGAATFGAAAAPLAVDGPPSDTGATLAIVVAVFCSLLAAIVSRLPDRGPIGTALGCAAVPWWAVAGAGLAAGDDPSLTMAGLAATGTAAGACAALATPGLIRIAPGVMLGAAGIAGQLLLFDRAGRSDVPVAVVALLLSLAGLMLLPRLAVEASGLARAAVETVDDQLLRRRIDAGRVLHDWAQGGLLAALLTAAVALAADGRSWALILTAAIAAVLTFRARRSRHRGEAVPLAVAAAGAAVTTAVGLAAAHNGNGEGVAAAALAVVGAAVLGTTVVDERPRPGTSRLLGLAESVVLATVVVAALAASGVFGFLADLGS